MTNKILIGDVHGCHEELKTLWSQLPLEPQTQVIFLGDLIDRGPDSEGVIRFIQTVAQDHDLVLVQGNHELKRLRQYQRGEEGTRSKLSAASWAFLQTHLLPYYSFQYLGLRYLAVHAGIFPAFVSTYPELPEPEQYAAWPRKLRERVERFTFCRYVNPQGNIVAMGQEKEADQFWAESYQNAFGHVFFGHQPYLDGVAEFRHATGLDTGCVFGGSLTAANLTPEGIHYISVPAQQAYASLSKAFDEH